MGRASKPKTQTAGLKDTQKELAIISALNDIVIPMQDYDKVLKDVIAILRRTFKCDKLKLLLSAKDKPEEIVDSVTKAKTQKAITVSCKIRGKTKAIITLYSVGGSAGERVSRLNRQTGKLANDQRESRAKSRDRQTVFGGWSRKSIINICRQAGVVIEDARLFRDLQAERDKISAIIHSAAEGIIVVDEKDEIILINPQTRQILGLKPNHRIPGAFTEFVIRPLQEELNKQDREFIFRELDLTTPHKMSIRIGMAPMKDFSGRRIGVVALFQDITREKEVERLKNELISTVSHELRTPLTTMKVFVSILSGGTAGPVSPDQKEYLNIVMSNMNRLARMINDLLDISKLEAGRMELKKRLVDPALLIKDQLASFKAEAENKKIALCGDIPPELPKLYIDPDRITQVIVNLIGNAIKFTPEEGRVDVRVGETSDSVEISVQDTGVGITKENFGKLFDRFQQIDRKPGAGAKGTGLGLAISKSIVELHKGKIWIDSELGKGSKFIFTLPKIEEESYFYECISDGTKRAQDNATPFSIIAFTVKGRTDLEKVFGKEEIKRLILNLEAFIRASVRRATDMVTHFNHGQFVAILCENQKEDLFSFIQRLKVKLESDEFKIKEKPLKIQVLSGTATFPDDGRTAQELIGKALKDIERD